MAFADVYAIALVVAVVVHLAVAIWLARDASQPSATFLAATVGLYAVGGLLLGFRLVVEARAFRVAAYGAGFAVGMVGYLTFFLFVLGYVGGRAWLGRRTVLVLGTWFGAIVVVAVTNPLHGLAWSSFETSGTAMRYLVGTPTSTFTALFFPATLIYYAGLGLLAYRALFGSDVERRQSGVLFVGFLAPLLALILGLTGAVPGPVEGVTTIGSVWTAVAVVTAVRRYDLFDLVPVARGDLFDDLDEAILVVDGRYRVLDYNERAVAAFPAVAGGAGDRLADVAPALLDGGEVVDTVAQVTEDGPRVFDVRVSELGDDDRRRGYGLILGDVTEERQRVRELQEKTDQLERFATTLSHDIRNPLSVATGALDLLLEEGDDERDGAERDAAGHGDTDDVHRRIEDARQALDRVEDIIDDMLLLARKGQRIDDAERTQVTLASVVQDAWETTETGEASLAVDLDPETTVYADRTRLLTAFENLFRNAVEHGGPEVTVTCGRCEDGFYLADDGPGIPPDERDEVFEFEYSGEGGTGVGLAVCRAIARGHGWTVDATEGSDGGARFDFRDVHSLTEPSRDSPPVTS